MPRTKITSMSTSRESRRNIPAPRAQAMVFTDASVCHHTGAAGWGAWVKRDGGVSEVFGGAFRDRMSSSLDAEISALANAVHRAVGWRLIEPGDVVMLQSDNIMALTRIRAFVGAADNPAKGGLQVAVPKRIKMGPVQKSAVAAIRKVVAAGRLQLVVRHVKAHTENAAGRSWVNDQCDAVAKEHMRARRAELTAQARAPETTQTQETA